MTRVFFLIFIPYISTISIDTRYPQFFHQSLHDSAVEITEGKTIGSFIAFINLVNDTNIILNEWLLNTTNKDFKIQPNGISYSLITTQVLDRERENFYNFTIDAQHLIPPYEKIFKPIRIRILDINDCTPSFNQTIYHTILILNQTNFTIQAYDCDEVNTDNSRISYSLSNYQDLFRINETTGSVECIKNFYNDERYDLIVVARDHGKPSLSSTILVKIQLISMKSPKLSSFSWLKIEQTSANILILSSILGSCLVFLCLLICLICCVNYKFKRSKNGNFNEKKFSSTSTINLSNDYQQKTVYDAVNMFPDTYYLPVKPPPPPPPQQQSSQFMDEINHLHTNEISLDIQQSLSTTSSPISTNDVGIKMSSDDGCYCSSDMSFEQSNNILLLNPSSLTLIANSKLSSENVRFNENNHRIDGILKRFESLYDSQINSDHCASYV
ncbi:unnamed protein product [Rotaria magnacalcarata]|uniref:Cadherin domain-containing protein n=1 Tax=Rotaria magnacalcarata TaxID=392030 RepID=A0A816P7C1_9BILA|nr:unnamed protein product [Rotaria magnacalcarata]CAF3758898.1 unnamed protein product [Rotaria magnacalcarata]